MLRQRLILDPGTSLGPYTIVAPIGAGAMGEVYRARDTRLGRDVAVKLLHADLAGDPNRLARFADEARAAGQLSHPQILSVHDVGSHDGRPYVVSELLDGETLRQRIEGGPLPVRKVIDYAIQIAHGLAAAHDRGIVHRDLKPENLFIDRDGRVRILDFGLAKLMRDGSPGAGIAHLSALHAETEPGVVLGTVGYMSPEQVRGQDVDQRTDIFALGAILYEMLAGRRAFQGDSAADTLTAILTRDPPEFAEVGQTVSPTVDRIVRHCLEKNPVARFQSVRDLAFQLEGIAGSSELRAAAGAGLVAGADAPPPPRSVAGRLFGRHAFAAALALAVAAAAALAGGYSLGRRSGAPPSPHFHRLTFRQGAVVSARFSPDGRTVLYSARWGGEPLRLQATRPESPESSALPLAEPRILAVSAAGEMAIQLRPMPTRGFTLEGTLARAPLEGGAPRELLEKVEWADWGPDSKSLAIVRTVDGRNRLEYPPGTVLLETAGWVSHPRVSPRGGLVAFIDHPVRGDDSGAIAVIGAGSAKRTLSGDWISAQGLAWSPGGDEIWFTATREGLARGFHAVTLAGRERLVDQVAGTLELFDVAPDGRALAAQHMARMAIACRPPGEPEERDLSYLDWSLVRDISDDGKFLLFDETGEGGGGSYVVYLRGTDGSAPVRLGEGVAVGLSPDGAWALAVERRTPRQLVLLPTRAGEARAVTRDSINHLAAAWFPDGRRILFAGIEPGRGDARCYVQDIGGGPPRAVTREGAQVGMVRDPVAPDGRSFLARMRGQTVIVPLDGGEPRPVPGLAEGEWPIRWGADGRSLFVYRPWELPARIERLDLESGRRTPWLTLRPDAPAGVAGLVAVDLTPDGRGYAYSYMLELSDLYLVEGWK